MPLITISRGSFSGGKAVAERIARALEHPLLSREEALAQAAREYGISDRELTAALNDSPPFWQQVPGKRLAYVKCVTAVLLEHARQGDLVYEGFVGHLLLSGIAHVLRVRVIADMDVRIKAAMSAGGLTRDQAVAHIQRVDRDRARWARLLYGIEWEDPSQYDLVLNVGRITLDGACETIVRISKLEEFTPTPQSRKKLEDLRLSCRVWAALARDPETRSAGIQVTADDGEVLITGAAGSTRNMDRLPRIAGDVEGVRSVRCEAGNGADWYW